MRKRYDIVILTIFFIWVFQFVGAAWQASQHSNRSQHQSSNEKYPTGQRAAATGANEARSGDQLNEGSGGSKNQKTSSGHEGDSWFENFVTFIEKREKFWVSFGTIIIAAFTVVLSVGTIFLFVATRKLVIGTDTTAKHELRAYVSVTATNGWNFTVGRIPSVQFKLHNHGQTPAYGVAHIAYVDIFPHPLPRNQGDFVQPIEGAQLPTQPIHPGAEIIGTGFMERPLTQDDLDRINTGIDFCIYLVGIAYYRDAFGSDRRTKFCVFIEGPTLRAAAQRANASLNQSGPTAIGIDWTYSHVHNEAT